MNSLKRMNGWPLVIFGILMMASGCASAPPYTEIASGALYKNPQKHFSIKSPDDGYLRFETKTGVVFSPAGGSDLNSPSPRGDFFVQAFPKETIPVDARGDVKASAKWAAENFGSARAKKMMVTVKEEPQTFQGQKALYQETFLPEAVHQGPANLTVIDRPAFEYANLVFYHGDYLYYVSCGIAVSTGYNSKQKLSASVSAATGERLRKFADGFSAL